MINNHTMTSEEIGKMMDEALGPNTPFPTPEEIALHKRCRELGISMQSYQADERLNAKVLASQETLKLEFSAGQTLIFDGQKGGQQ